MVGSYNFFSSIHCIIKGLEHHYVVECLQKWSTVTKSKAFIHNIITFQGSLAKLEFVLSAYLFIALKTNFKNLSNYTCWNRYLQWLFMIILSSNEETISLGFRVSAAKTTGAGASSSSGEGCMMKVDQDNWQLVGNYIRQVEPSARVQSALERDGRGGEVMEEDCSETVGINMVASKGSWYFQLWWYRHDEERLFNVSKMKSDTLYAIIFHDEV